MATKTKQEIEIEGQTLTLTNLDKILYPDSAFTKGQVIDYYIRVAPYLLPHFLDRPVTLKRLPDGVGGQAFYEKDKPRFAPPWLPTFPVPRRGKGSLIQYILINNLATLVWCANAASLELHPFLHRAPAIDCPNAIVFDLDPGEGANMAECAAVAFLVRDLLADSGLHSFPKVSGSKGLQLYVPLNVTVTYEQTRTFAHATAEQLAAEYPDRIVSAMAKALRPGKVFIDWSQNSDFKTTVGVYSLRAKTGEPYVSLPVSWEELRGANPVNLQFSPAVALDRLANGGDLFAPLLSLQQELPSRPARRKTTKNPRESASLLKGLPKSQLTFHEPMLAKLVSQLPRGPEWQYEVKLDGYRALAIRDKTGGHLLSRRNRSYGDKFASIEGALQSIEPGSILDGEVVALNEEGRPTFNVLQHYRPGAAPLVYFAFDVLAYRGLDTRDLPLKERRALLEKMVEQNQIVKLSTILDAQPEQVIAAVRAQRLEGIVAKRVESRYRSGDRSGDWVKLKLDDGQELVVGGYRATGASAFDNLAVGYYEGGELIFIAKLKNGFSADDKRKILEQLQSLSSETCPFANLPEPKSARRGEALTAEAMRHYRWVRPEMVVQAEFTDWTAANHLRHARFTGVREDKDPKTVVHEKPHQER